MVPLVRPVGCVIVLCGGGSGTAHHRSLWLWCGGGLGAAVEEVLPELEILDRGV